ncbi:MAG TPA: DUF6787 family protein [Bacteroidia bacterium]
MSLTDKLKERWKVKSGFQVLIILVVFACTGYSIVLIKHLIGIDKTTTIANRILFYVAVLPIYNLLLLGYGFIFGQFKFFLEFEKRFFGRLFPWLKKKK